MYWLELKTISTWTNLRCENEPFTLPCRSKQSQTKAQTSSQTHATGNNMHNKNSHHQVPQSSSASDCKVKWKLELDQNCLLKLMPRAESLTTGEVLARYSFVSPQLKFEKWNRKKHTRHFGKRVQHSKEISAIGPMQPDLEVLYDIWKLTLLQHEISLHPFSPESMSQNLPPIIQIMMIWCHWFVGLVPSADLHEKSHQSVNYIASSHTEETPALHLDLTWTATIDQ